METALSEKENTAMKLISAVAGEGKTAIAFGGGKDSVALLHLALRAQDFNFSLPVIVLAPPKRHHALFYFIEKALTAMGIRQNILHLKNKGPATYETSVFAGAAGIAAAASGEGFRSVLTGIRKDEEGTGEGLGRTNLIDGALLVNPLLDFTEEEVFRYIREHNLPLCSLYSGSKKLGCLVPAGTPVVPAAPSDDDAEEMRARLRSLGYV